MWQPRCLELAQKWMCHMQREVSSSIAAFLSVTYLAQALILFSLMECQVKFGSASSSSAEAKMPGARAEMDVSHAERG